MGEKLYDGDGRIVGYLNNDGVVYLLGKLYVELSTTDSTVGSTKDITESFNEILNTVSDEMSNTMKLLEDS